MPHLLHKFLGTSRWQALWTAYLQQSNSTRTPQVGHSILILSFILAALPILLTVLETPHENSGPGSFLPTLSFGVCAVLAALFRSRLDYATKSTAKLGHTLSITHTAVALGCIPAVLCIAFAPSLLADRHDTIVTAVGSQSAAQFRPTVAQMIFLIAGIAAWVAATEELLFRGLLLSSIRRSSLFHSPQKADFVAILVSALLFGLAHWATWGFVPALALFGLGLGFGIAYVANGEQLFPLMLYHFVFDLASISVSLY